MSSSTSQPVQASTPSSSSTLYQRPPDRIIFTDQQKRKRSRQYVGYPGVSEWMASADDFFVLRRFSKINARYLLYLQHEIGKREHRLEDMDEFMQTRQEEGIKCHSFEEDTMPARTQLIEEVGTLLRKYYDHINAYTQVRNKRTADKRHLQNLDNIFHRYKHAVVQKERHWWNRRGELHTGDIFEMWSFPSTTLRAILTKPWIIKHFPNQKPDQFEGDVTYHFSNTQINGMLCFATVIVGLGLLFAPRWYLRHVNSVDHMLGVVTWFASLFALWLWVAAGSRQFVILTGTAAYTAVLYIYFKL